MKNHSSYSVGFRVNRHPIFRFCGGVLLAWACLDLSATQAQATTFVLGTSTLLVGSDTETNSVVLAVTPATSAWTATTNDSWLHLSTANQSGTGSTNVIFSSDANSGSTRTGTLTIGSQTLTVTQAGSGFQPAQPLTTVFSLPIFLENIAVDGEGDVYIAAYGDGSDEPQNIYTWAPTNGNYLGIPGLSRPSGVAVDGAGNVYIADTGNNAVEEWTATGHNLITLVSSNLSSPYGVAVDGLGNVYIADTGNNVVKEWTAANSSVATLVTGLSEPEDVAVDVAGNVYVSDSGNGVVKEWLAANSNVVTVATATGGPLGVAVDGSGNVYAGVPSYNGRSSGYLLKWSAASGIAAQIYVPSEPHEVGGVAVNNTGDVFFTDVPYGQLDLLPNDFVDLTARTEGASAGSDSWPAVLPVTANATASSDQSWLTVDGVTNGVVSVSFTASTNGGSRMANITLLGQIIPLMQMPASISLGTNLLFEGPAAGSDSVALTVIPQTVPWTATASASWLHLSPANQSGTGSTNVDFSFDANTGPSRSGTLTIAGQTLTVMQSSNSDFLNFSALLEANGGGSNSVVLTVSPQNATWTATANANWLHLSPASQSGTGSATLVFSFDANPGPVRSGTITIAGLTLTVIQGTPSFSLGTTVLVEGPTEGPDSIVLVANPNLSPWEATTSTNWLHLSPANQSGTGSTNVVFSYDANPGATRIGTLTIGGQTLAVTQAGSTFNPYDYFVPIVLSANPQFSSGPVYTPEGPAFDGAGNVYFANTLFQEILEWSAAKNNVTTLVSSGLANPSGVAADGAGNVYIANTGSNAILKWSAASSNVTTLVSSGLSSPSGVALDDRGDVYIADTGNNAVREWSAANSNVITLVSSGLSGPSSVAVDAAGNVYIADSGNNAVKEWIEANSNVIIVVSPVSVNSTLTGPQGVGVDGAANVYIAGSANNSELFWFSEWMPASGSLSLIDWYNYVFPQGPYGVAVNGRGNVCYSVGAAYGSGGGIIELSYLFVDATARSETSAAGTDAWVAVLPVTTRFDATSDQPWLTIDGITNGVVSFSFAANTAATNRTANISFLNQVKPITQLSPPALTGVQMLSRGVIQFAFSNMQQTAFTVSSTTNLLVPLSEWTVIAVSSNVAPGTFQFTSLPTTNDPQRFYRVTSP